MFVPNQVKQTNLKLFNLMLGTNETRFLVFPELCECKCELNENIYNSEQEWNHDECWCECKKLDDLSSCRDDYKWNLSTCNCECNKACIID